MIDVKLNEKKNLKFIVEIYNFDIRDIKGSLKLNYNEMDYSFPINIVDNAINVDLPPLSEVIKFDKSRKNIKADLEIIAGDTYLNPWSDTFNIQNPIDIQIKEIKVIDIEEEKNDIKPIIEKKKCKKKKDAELIVKKEESNQTEVDETLAVTTVDVEQNTAKGHVTLINKDDKKKKKKKKSKFMKTIED